MIISLNVEAQNIIKPQCGLINIDHIKITDNIEKIILQNFKKQNDNYKHFSGYYVSNASKNTPNEKQYFFEVDTLTELDLKKEAYFEEDHSKNVLLSYHTNLFREDDSLICYKHAIFSNFRAITDLDTNLMYLIAENSIMPENMYYDLIASLSKNNVEKKSERKHYWQSKFEMKHYDLLILKVKPSYRSSTSILVPGTVATKKVDMCLILINKKANAASLNWLDKNYE